MVGDTMRSSLMLSDLLDSLGIRDRVEFEDIEVTGIKSDSRDVLPGDVFIAIRGLSADGHRFVTDAARNGAVAAIVEEMVEADTTVVLVENTARALAMAAAQLYGDPASDLRMIGVTGTNGKTSTTNILRAICEETGWGKTGLIGTIGYGTGGELVPGVHTTPEPLTLHQLLWSMKEQSCRGVVMEVSSHAVRQQRIWGIDFDMGVLTNITRDHLDYHPTFEDYIDAKREFCYSLIEPGRRKTAGTLIYSRDNDMSRSVGDEFPGTKVSVGITEAAEVFATGVMATLNGTNFTLHLPDEAPAEVRMSLLGTFTVSNALLAAAAAKSLGIGLEGIIRGLESVKQVPGRFEPLGGSDRPRVIVDYSHTPDSLERTLQFCLNLGPSRLIAVFGCGGDRDRGKRPLMGAIAQKYAHICYVTSDNPRTEDPLTIIEDIVQGMDRRSAGLRVEVDRRVAIEKSIGEATAGDIVAICGKGHEDYQIVGTTKHRFDDREEAERALGAWKPKSK